MQSAPVGGYAVSVWTEPSPSRSGPVQEIVAVMRPETHAPVLDATVRVAAARRDGTGAAAGGEGSRADDPLGIRSMASLMMPDAGPWRITVRVDGPAAGGDVGFPLPPHRGRGFGRGPIDSHALNSRFGSGRACSQSDLARSLL